jgi:ABC-type transporter MlaC component
MGIKDFRGAELNVGDQVAVFAKDYRCMVQATVLKCNKQKVSVKYSWQNHDMFYMVDAGNVVKL